MNNSHESVQDLEIREAVAEHSVEIKQINNSLDKIQNSLDAIFRQMREQNKFPIMPIITTLFGTISVIALLAGGYIGKPMTEIKHRQELIESQILQWAYTLGKREVMIDNNAASLINLDVTLQREMRLLDETNTERVKGQDEVLQREMRLLGDVLNEKFNALDARLRNIEHNRYTKAEGDRVQRQVDEISSEQRRRTSKVYDK